MAIVKRGGAYWLDTRIDGRRIRRSLHTDSYHLAKAEAARLEAELREKAKAAIAAAASPGLWDLADRYIAWARINKAPSAVPDEERRLNYALTFLAGLSPPVILAQELTAYHIEQLRAHLAAAGRSKATINRYCQALRGMIYRAQEWEIYKGANPLRKVKFFREGARIKPLTDDQVRAGLAAADTLAAGKWASPLQRVYPDLCRLVLHTGLRRAEALRLRWSDIRGGALHVEGKGKKLRVVPLSPRAKAVISRQPRRAGDEYVFAVPYRDSRSALRRTSIAISKAIGCRWWIHGLRHAFATKLIEAGVDIPTVGELLGHSAAMTTLLYTHSTPDRKRQAVGLLDGIFGHIPGHTAHGPEDTRRADLSQGADSEGD